MRKILIGFVSLGVVLGIYLLYARVSETPELDTDRAAEALQSAADGNALDLDSEMGKIGDVGVGPVRKARYVTLNDKTKDVEREFGFEKLLHEIRDVWEIEKPYMNVYRRNFKCYVTADKGQVQVETAVGRTTPKDATFSSNVVIHIVPTGTSSFKESFVYLDDVIFLSEKSLLSTAGPVRFESEDAKMHGKGLELIYNEQGERLEYFRIIDLESMSYRVTNSQAAPLSSTQTPAAASVEPDIPAEIQEPNETTVAGAPDELSAEQTPDGEALVTKAQQPVEQQEGEYYRCVLNDNVLIDTPEQLIFADEKLTIHDIFWSKEFFDQADKVDANSTDETQTNRLVAEQAPSSEQGIAEPNVPLSPLSGSNRPAPEPNEPNEAPPEEPAWIVITCDGGLLILPRDSRRAPDEVPETDLPRHAGTVAAGAEAAASNDECPDPLHDGTKRTKFYARTIDYNVVTGDVIAGGLSELTYYRTDATTALPHQSFDAPPAEANEPPTPVKVTAREGAKYSKASNQVVFADCVCTMPQAGLTEQRDVTFRAPEITVDLPQEKSKQPDILAAGPVELAFYMEDANRPAVDSNSPTPQSFGDGALTPVTVNARTRAHYSAALNQMAFEGDCRCTMLREDPNVLEEYVLLSDRMTIDLAEDANDRTPGPASGVEHLTATGEVVRLATTRRAKAGGAFADVLPAATVPRDDEADANGTGLLGGIELKCRQFDYDAVQQIYWATGPGIIKLNNAIPADPNEPREPFSLREACWAIVGGFDTLRYSLLENRILADAAPQQKLWIIYAPLVAEKDHQDVTATASHVDAFLRETVEGRTELSTLNATGGILYEDDRSHQFIGSELFYDHTTAIVNVKGDEIQPCFYNGIPVDQIKYDVKTDQVDFNVVGPGAIQFGK